MKWLPALAGLALLPALALAGPQLQQLPSPKLALVVPQGTSNSVSGRALKLIYTEALRRIGYQLELIVVPTARATAMSDLGDADGEINRVADYGDAHPNLIRVSPSHFSVNFYAYTKDALPLGSGWQALKSSPFRVDYVRGCKKCETELPKVVPSAYLSGVNSLTLALRKLEASRSDVLVDMEGEAEAVLALPEFRSSTVQKRALLESVAMHSYLHRKHAQLVPQLSAALTAMKKEGLLEEYRSKAMLAEK